MSLNSLVNQIIIYSTDVIQSNKHLLIQHVSPLHLIKCHHADNAFGRILTHQQLIPVVIY